MVTLGKRPTSSPASARRRSAGPAGEDQSPPSSRSGCRCRRAGRRRRESRRSAAGGAADRRSSARAGSLRSRRTARVAVHDPRGHEELGALGIRSRRSRRARLAGRSPRGRIQAHRLQQHRLGNGQLSRSPSPGLRPPSTRPTRPPAAPAPRVRRQQVERVGQRQRGRLVARHEQDDRLVAHLRSVICAARLVAGANQQRQQIVARLRPRLRASMMPWMSASIRRAVLRSRRFAGVGTHMGG